MKVPWPSQVPFTPSGWNEAAAVCRASPVFAALHLLPLPSLEIVILHPGRVPRLFHQSCCRISVRNPILRRILLQGCDKHLQVSETTSLSSATIIQSTGTTGSVLDLTSISPGMPIGCLGHAVSEVADFWVLHQV